MGGLSVQNVHAPGDSHGNDCIYHHCRAVCRNLVFFFFPALDGIGRAGNESVSGSLWSGNHHGASFVPCRVTFCAASEAEG